MYGIGEERFANKGTSELKAQPRWFRFWYKYMSLTQYSVLRTEVFALPIADVDKKTARIFSIAVCLPLSFDHFSWHHKIGHPHESGLESH